MKCPPQQWKNQLVHHRHEWCSMYKSVAINGDGIKNKKQQSLANHCRHNVYTITYIPMQQVYVG
jgi:hypothetical protein